MDRKPVSSSHYIDLAIPVALQQLEHEKMESRCMLVRRHKTHSMTGAVPAAVGCGCGLAKRHVDEISLVLQGSNEGTSAPSAWGVHKKRKNRWRQKNGFRQKRKNGLRQSVHG